MATSSLVTCPRHHGTVMRCICGDLVCYKCYEEEHRQDRPPKHKPAVMVWDQHHGLYMEKK